MAEHHDSSLYFLSREYNWSKGQLDLTSVRSFFYRSRRSTIFRAARKVAGQFRLLLYHSFCVMQEIFSLKPQKISRFIWNFSWQTWNFAAEDNSKPRFSDKTDEEKRIFLQFLWFPIWVHINFGEFTWILMKIYIHWAQELSLSRGDTRALSRVFALPSIFLDAAAV